MKYILSIFTIYLVNIIRMNCDWVEIPHINRNSHSYPEEHLEVVFLKPKTTLATTATTPIPKKIYPKETFSEVIERPPANKNKKQILQRRNDDIVNTKIDTNRQNVKLDNNNQRNVYIDNNKDKENVKNDTDYDADDYYDYEIEYEENVSKNKDDFSKSNEDVLKSDEDVSVDEEEISIDDEDITKDEDSLREKMLKTNTTNREGNNKYSDNLLPLLKNIQDSLIRTSKGSMTSKITFLQNLRDNLLYNLKEKIQNLWSGRSRRDTSSHSREHKEEYHMDSHEGPLITIGFLTFAVYLIKLVLQLLFTLKSTQSVILFPTTTTTTAANLILGRRKRSEEEVDEIQSKIVTMMKTFKERSYGTF